MSILLVPHKPSAPKHSLITDQGIRLIRAMLIITVAAAICRPALNTVCDTAATVGALLSTSERRTAPPSGL